MRRREFVTLFGAATLVMPFTAHAQQPRKSARIGLLDARPNIPLFAAANSAFSDELRQLGWIEGQNLTIEYRSHNDPGVDLAALVGELLRSNIDALATVGPESVLQTAADATHTIPIAMIAINFDPIARGYVSSLARPGGNRTDQDCVPNVIVTDESLTQCVSEVRQAIGDRDQTKIKTVPRRGYRFVVQVSQRSPSTIGPAASEPVTAELQSGHRSARPMPDPPSIAVLPFANLSSDPHRDYFSDGITEDIITELSRFSELVVIARTSAFQYKGKAIDIRQVGRELNVRYILEGSIRWAGNRVRITAQLIDSATGAHRWADSFDREVGDDFTVQYEVARSIVLTLAAHVTKAETKRTLLKPPSTWEAYDYYLRGADAFRSGYGGHTRDSICEARRLLEQSLLIDPNYARAHALLARTHLHAYIEPADDDYLRASTLERAYELAKRAVQLDPNLPEVHSQLGWVVMFLRQHDAAIAEFERATVLNRNFNDYGYGFALALAGRAARAIEILHANMRLDPFQFRWLAVHGHAHYMLGRYEEAVPPLRECASYFPNLRIVHVWLAATYGKLGRLAEARSAAADVRRIEPTFTIDKWKVTAVYKDSEDAERLFEGLREAGLPQR